MNTGYKYDLICLSDNYMSLERICDGDVSYRGVGSVVPTVLVDNLNQKVNDGIRVHLEFMSEPFIYDIKQKLNSVGFTFSVSTHGIFRLEKLSARQFLLAKLIKDGYTVDVQDNKIIIVE